MSLSTCTRFCSNVQLYPIEESDIYGERGKGPTLIGKLSKVSNTGLQKISSLFYKSDYTSQRSQVLDTPGAMLNTAICKRFFNRIVEIRKDLNFIHTFYKHDFRITDTTLDKLKEQLTQELVNNNIDSTGPICIPIVMIAQYLPHIAVIEVIDNTVYYYDSQGIASNLRKLSDGRTLRDFIELCQEILTNGKGVIEENSPIHQWDTYNCGAYVSHYVFQTMVMGKTHKELINSEIPITYIERFRKAMAEDLDSVVSQ